MDFLLKSTKCFFACFHGWFRLLLLGGCVVLLHPFSSLAAPARAKTNAAKPLPGYEIIGLGRGHFNRLFLAITVAGKRGLAMLDTGANESVLNATTYQMLQKAGATKPKAARLNGFPVPLVVAPDFHVGHVDLGSAPVLLVPRRLLFEQTPFDGYRGGLMVDAIMGADLLRRENAILDCARLGLYLNTDPSKRIRTSSFTANGWTGVPMSDAGNDFTVPCMINGKKFRIIVDTGAPFTHLDRNALRTLGIDARDLPMEGGIIGTRAQRAALVSLDRLQIGDYLATNVHMTTTPLPMEVFGGTHDPSSGGPIVGLLGGDMLAANGAVIDIGGKVLYLKHPTGSTVAGKKP